MLLEIVYLNAYNTGGKVSKKHKHNCFEIIFFLSGDGHELIGERRHVFHSGYYCIISPKTFHREQIEDTADIFFIGFQYDGSFGPLQEGMYKKNSENILSIMQNIADEYRSHQSNFEQISQKLLEVLIITLLRNDIPVDNKNNSMQFVKSYIIENYNQKINFKSLADISGYSFDHFRHVFSDNYGCSPQTFLIDTRLENARKLLKSSEYSCTEITSMCGFSNSAQFSQMFKKRYGVTPLKYQKSADK